MRATRLLSKRLSAYSPRVRHLLLRSGTNTQALRFHSNSGANAADAAAASPSPSPSPSYPATSTVDPSQLAHFAQLASSWWDAHGSSRLLHLMNPLRHAFIARCLSGQADASPAIASAGSPSLHYLDVGCGGGIFAESAARLAHTASVTAVDPSGEVLAVARAHMRQDPMLVERGKLAYQQLAIEELPVPLGDAAGYDIVTLFEVLEHVSAPAAFLQHLTRQVKPGGWLVLSTIARTWTSWATTKLVAEDILKMVPRGTHDWDKYINEAELRRWFLKEKGNAEWDVAGARCMGVVYVPGLGWKEIDGSEQWGNYFFGIRRRNV